MVEKRRGPGAAYDSKQRLLAAACALLAERGFEATSPTMILQRSGIGHGSLYHHYRGKEDLTLDAVSHMRGHTIAFLEGQAQPVTLAATRMRKLCMRALRRRWNGCSTARTGRR